MYLLFVKGVRLCEKMKTLPWICGVANFAEKRVFCEWVAMMKIKNKHLPAYDFPEGAEG